MTTVFDVAAELIERNGGSMETVKLQKLCFYAFGWYAHLTGEPLFGEKFYAMPKGPVVGELLSAHARRETATLDMIDDQRSAREDEAETLDGYKEAVLDAVWAAYGDMSSWALVDQTHTEDVWTDAWAARRPGSKRGNLSRRALIDYFIERAPRRDEGLELPPALVSRASADDLAQFDADATVHKPFVDAVRAFHFAS